MPRKSVIKLGFCGLPPWLRVLTGDCKADRVCVMITDLYLVDRTHMDKAAGLSPQVSSVDVIGREWEADFDGEYAPFLPGKLSSLAVAMRLYTMASGVSVIAITLEMQATDPALLVTLQVGITIVLSVSSLRTVLVVG